ncbi:xanthine dehydrogenase family protein molybdopterin-binding subunit, partial [Chloroflexota bacterium]
KGVIASSTVYVAGGAAKAAAADAKQQILSYTGQLLNVKPEELGLKEGRVYKKATPESGFTITEITKQAYKATEGAMTFIGRASYEDPVSAQTFAAQFAEVEVDIETGLVEIGRIVAIHDIGKAINPMVVEGQIEGAIQQGVGFALTEDPILDGKTGRMMNPNFANYMVLTSLDMPKIQTGLVESIDPTGPFGAKGVGEIALEGIAPAIANAIYNATGVRLKELPMTQEKLFKALRGKESSDEKRI